MRHLIRRDPFIQRLSDIEKELSRFFGTESDTSNVVMSDWLPPIDIVEKEKEYVVKADLPGIEPNNIEISMDNNILTIKGERKSEVTEEEKGVVRIERSVGTFYRRFSLPDGADADNIKAKSDKGVLTITIPKSKQRTTRRISVE